MEIITGERLHAMVEENPHLFSAILPELVKRLILSGCKDVKHIRIPSLDDIWAPGFDGVVECEEGTRFVNSGYSIWEFGTSKQALDKIDSDFDKRTKDPKGLDKTKTSFYLVSPRIWAFDKTKSITEWETEKNDWKTTRVYDAVILADWINSEPAVCAWLLEKVQNTKDLSFSTLNIAWEALAHKTEPAITHTMFLEGRGREVEELKNALSQKTIRIKADTFIESVGFAVSALLQDPDYAEKTIVINDYATYRALSSICNNKLFLINYRIETDIINDENTVVLCYNKEATSIKDCIELSSLTKNQYENALRDMGIDASHVNSLYAFTHGNIRALVRRIPGLSTEKCPDWAKERDVILLAPLMFLGSFCVDTDQVLVELLSGEKYEAVEKKYGELLKIEDSPIKKTDKYYTIVDYESTFFTLNIQPSDVSFQRLRNTTNRLLTALRDEGRWNNRIAYDSSLHRIMRRLIFNYVYFSYEHQSSTELVSAVREVLPFIYEDNTAKFVLDNLYLLAEAEPETVLNYLDSELSNKEHNLLDLFSGEPYDSRYASLLSALDELALHDTTAIRACKILFNLYQIDRKYTFSNSPESSLQTALNFWNNSGELKLLQKKQLFLSFIAQNAIKGSELFASVLNTHSFFRSERLGARELPTESITYSDVFSAIEEVGAAAFEHATQSYNAKLLGSLLESYQFFPPEFLAKYAESVNPNDYYEGCLLHLNYELRRIVFNIQKYGWDEKKPYLDCLKEWILHTTPSTPALALFWAFTKPYECFAEELLQYKKDPLGEIEAAKELRVKLLNDLISIHGHSAGLQLVKGLSDDTNWGSILCEAFSGESISSLIDVLVLQGKYRIAGGVINRTNKQTADALFYRLSEDDKKRILPFVMRKDSYEWLDSPEKEQEYWASKTMAEYNTYEYQKLLEYNPTGLMCYCYQQTQNNLKQSVDLSLEILAAVNRQKKCKDLPDVKDDTFIGEIIDRIDKEHYSDDWAVLCLELFENHIISSLTQGVSLYFFLNPEKLVSFISNNSEKYYLIKENYILPPQAYKNQGQLFAFFDVLIRTRETYLSLAGHILGRTSCGSDGIFPHEYVRDYLERQDNKKLDDSVYVGRINSRGLRTISDGTNALRNGKKLLEQASAIEIWYPHSASILRNLAESCFREAKWDQITSEIDY